MLRIRGHSDDVITVDYERSGERSFSDEYYPFQNHGDGYGYAYIHLHTRYGTKVTVLVTFDKPGTPTTWFMEVVDNPAHEVFTIKSDPRKPYNSIIEFPDCILDPKRNPYATDTPDCLSESALRTMIENIDPYRLRGLPVEQMRRIHEAVYGYC